MPVGQYPFIDIAVHGLVRERFAKGEALVLFSAGLEAIIWADGAGAALFGYDSLYEFMDEGASGKPALLRQLRTAAARLPATGHEQTATLRIPSGFRTRLVTVSLTGLELADGTSAVLVGGGAPRDTAEPADRARRIIAGLGDGQTHVAALDEKGAVLAASADFGKLALTTDLLTGLVSEVSREPDRLVKRMIATGRGRTPAAIARLSDAPALNLIFAIETEADGGGNEAIAAPSPDVTDGPADAAPSVSDPGGPPPPKAAADAGVAETTEAFAFDPHGKPARFVWKIDAEGRFSEISADFGRAVGPNAADLIGRRFEDVARVFGFDRDGVISELLRRHDTWSGKSVLWPVQGTNLAVPVDLAALPTYTRERAFDGFRGFGIVRVGDAAEDLEAIGLSLVGNEAEPPASETAAEEASATPVPAEKADNPGDEGNLPESDAAAGAEAPDATPPSVEPEGEASQDGPPASANAAVSDPDDPFRGETPALRIVPNEGRRESDKVIDLEQRRPRQRDPLSSGERAAFREIGKRLAEAFGKRAAREQPPSAKETADTDSAAAGAEKKTGRDDGRKTEPARGKQPAEASPEANAAQGAPAEAHAGAASPGEGRAAPLPSAFAVGHRTRSLDEEIVADLPVALLVHYGETLYYANEEFLTLTGHECLEALEKAGGLGSLFASPDYTGETEQRALPGTMRLVRADGGELAVHARLQAIGWRDRRALMLSLRRAEATGAPAAPGAPERAEDADAKRAAALRVEVEELRSILETATDGVIILGEHGDIRSMNRSASALFDYDEADTRGQPFAKLFAHESQRAVMDYLGGLSEHGVASVLNDGREVIGREASGGFIPLFMTIGRLSGSNGFCAVMRDITQWKRTEEELRAAKYAAEQASSHKSEFLARVSHEIRTPLNAIIGFADMMAEQRFGPIGSPRYLEYAHDIGRSGKHVVDIVNDLLDISKIEAGEMEVSFAAVALNDTIAEAVSLLQPQANSQRVIIRTSLSSSVPEIVADERSIKQIGLNLIANAIRFTPPGGQIVVSTAYEANGSVALRIRDTGVGMSRAELDQAMKPFRQVKGASRPEGEGTGLGLPLTKAMVEANRAQFDIRSAPGEGTLVEITFPPQRVLAD